MKLYQSAGTGGGVSQVKSGISHPAKISGGRAGVTTPAIRTTSVRSKDIHTATPNVSASKPVREQASKQASKPAKTPAIKRTAEKRGKTLTVSKPASRKRIVVELSQRSYERLQEIKELTGAETTRSVVLEALKMYDYLMIRQRAGCEVLIVEENGPPRSLPPIASVGNF